VSEPIKAWAVVYELLDPTENKWIEKRYHNGTQLGAVQMAASVEKGIDYTQHGVRLRTRNIRIVELVEKPERVVSVEMLQEAIRREESTGLKGGHLSSISSGYLEAFSACIEYLKGEREEI
jgi:hypothetical protein